MGNTVTICFANNKGGSGKSTSCSNVGAALAGMGKKVLMVDGDMQLNLSLSFFSEEEVLEMAAGEKNLYYAIGHQSDLSDFIVHTKYENLDLVPSSTLMSSVEYELFTKWQREFIEGAGISGISGTGAGEGSGIWFAMGTLECADYERRAAFTGAKDRGVFRKCAGYRRGTDTRG